MNELNKKTPEGVHMIPNDSDPLDIEADIEGPVDTPYQDGIFRCKLVISSDFPNSPPKGYFLTKIFHPNISEKGEICVNTLKKDWDPKNWSLYNILEVIKCLLIFPFPESALNEEAARLFMDNYQEYFKYAKLLTELYAHPKDKKHQISGHIPLNLTKSTSVDQNFTFTSKLKNEISPIKTNFLSNSLDIENVHNLQIGGINKTKENFTEPNKNNLLELKNEMSFGSSPFNFTPNNDLNNNFNSNFSNMVNEDVLTTVTNFSVVGGNNKGIHIENNNVNKKENDKKKWLKRI